MRIKKNHRIILYYLLVQLVFGGLIMFGVFTENSASEASLLGILVYLALAAGFIILSILLYYFNSKVELRQAYFTCIFATLLFWVLAWPISLKIIELMPRVDFEWRGNRESEERNRLNLTLLMDRLGLPHCASNDNCEIQFDDGERFALNMEGDNLKASCHVKILQREDTIAWISLLKNKASYFLPVNKKQNLDSLTTTKGKFYFRYDQGNDHLYLGIGTVSGIYYQNSNGNFHITVPMTSLSDHF